MGTIAVYEYFLVTYKRLWRASLFGQFIVPLLFVVSIGSGLGTFVNRGGALGVDYMSYLVPGLLASTAMQLAVSESTFPVYSSFAWSRFYFAIQATPIRVWELIAGQLGFLLTRVLLASVVFLAVMVAAGTVHGVGLLGMLPVVLLFGLAIGAATMAFSAWTSSESTFALLFRFVIAPLSLFSGVFFPIDQLPSWLRAAALLSPLWHAVELCREFAGLTFPLVATLTHTGYLAVWTAAGLVLVRASFIRRLAK